MLPIKRRNLMDLYGVIKVNRPLPGIQKEREIARKRRATELDRKARLAK